MWNYKAIGVLQVTSISMIQVRVCDKQEEYA